MRYWTIIRPLLLSLAIASSGPVTADNSRHWIQPVSSSLLDGTPWATAAKPHNLDPWLLYAITLEESGEYDASDGLLAPWPYQLHYQGQTLKYGSQEEAAAQIKRWEAAGIINYDIGPLQINRRFHGHRVDQLQDLLTVKRSLDLAAFLLAETFQLSGSDEELGIGRYRSWEEKEARAYARRIQDIRIQLPE